jgi:hypothetical protein
MLPPSLRAARIFAGQNTSAALTGDGKLIAWGRFSRAEPAPDGVMSAVVSDGCLLLLVNP